MTFVTLKSQAQLDAQTLHRVRDHLVRDRTSLMNQVKNLLLERGHVVSQGRSRLPLRLKVLLEEEAGELSGRMRALVADVCARWRKLPSATPARSPGGETGGMAGPGSSAGHHGWPAPAARDYQAGQQVPAQDADPGCPSLDADAPEESSTRLGAWLRSLLAHAHANKAVVALAAKVARTVWALLRHEAVYEAAPMAA